MSAYIALIHKDDDSDYGVSFPDFPGCVTAGSTLDEARRMAAEALAFHIEGMKDDGDAIPEPSDLATIMQERENQNAVAFLVEAPTRPSRTVRVNITLSEETLNEIDAYAEREGYTRSGLIAKAAHEAIMDFSHKPSEREIFHRETHAVWRYDEKGDLNLVYSGFRKLDVNQARDLETKARLFLRAERTRNIRGQFVAPPR